MKQNKQNKRSSHQPAGIFLAAVLGLVCLLSPVYLAVEHTGSADRAKPVSLQSADTTLSGAALYSSAAVLVRCSDSAVLLDQESGLSIYPASLTKMMTVLVGLEQLESLEERITIPADIYSELYESGASMAGFFAGERVRAEDLLYGILLPSGAEACLALALHVADTEQDFAALMNQKAAELGMRDTHFTNATGLHDPAHVSTVRDMAVLVAYGLEIPAFRTMLLAGSYTTSGGLEFQSTLSKAAPDLSVTGGEILGGKTGYTSQAGLCLASVARIEGEMYILVTAGAPGDHESLPLHVLDARQVYNQIGA
ncbi:MAG: D-alanyl-D-alanine carboxypeptidase [Clostridiales bacterium]|nr:D-alanyl-D-alanine carboxypeptidase [Clostridiales bacterium]